jgi:hypothetical protein
MRTLIGVLAILVSGFTCTDPGLSKDHDLCLEIHKQESLCMSQCKSTFNADYHAMVHCQSDCINDALHKLATINTQLPERESGCSARQGP